MEETVQTLHKQPKITDIHSRAAEGNSETSLRGGAWEGSERAWQRLRTEREPPGWTGPQGLAAASPYCSAKGFQATQPEEK